MSDRNRRPLPPLADLDTDGAIREAAATVDGDTRAAFLRKAGVGVGGLLAGGAMMGALPKLARAAGPLPWGDIHILNFALTLEYLEAAFYKEALSKAGLTGDTKAFCTLVASHEATHVAALKDVLGSKAVKSPKFDFQGTTEDEGKFQQTSFVLENTGVHAYLGQAGNIQTPAVLAAAASIVTIEARHSAAIAVILNKVGGKSGITPDGAFDTPLTKDQVLAAVKKTKFIVG